MLSEIIEMTDFRLLLFAVLLIGISIGVSIDRFFSATRRPEWRRKSRQRWERAGKEQNISNGPTTPKLQQQTDAADQLRIVMGATFTAKAILNKGEARVLRQLDRLVFGCKPGWQVMAQVSLGEILRSKDVDAYGCINSKRVDLLLVDENCQPRHAIEYQGAGHYQMAAAARDAIKKEALRRAGIGYHEVVAGHTTPSDLRRLVEKLLLEPMAAS